MDPLGVAQAILALALFPGGLFFAICAWAFSRAAGQSCGTLSALAVPSLLSCCVADLAVALAPLPASPVSTVPPGTGPGPNLIAAGILVGVAAALSDGAVGARRPRALLAVVIPAAALTVGAGTLSLPTIGASAGLLFGARAATTAAVLFAAPAVLGAGRDASPTQLVTLCAAALLAFALLTPSHATGGIAALWVAAVVATVVAYGLFLRVVGRLLNTAHGALLGVSALSGVAAVACVAVAGR